jgi:hypothetical protein
MTSMSGEALGRARTIGFAAAASCAALWLFDLHVDAPDALRAYLPAYLFWLGLALGAERLEGAIAVVPYLAALFASILFGARLLYPWAAPEFVWEPRWRSPIYAMVGWGFLLSALCGAIVLRADPPPDPDKRAGDPIHDFGNLLLAFLILWAYLWFSQLLIIWSGDLPEKISSYILRRGDGWTALAAVAAVLGFAIPFFLLLLSDLKRDLRPLAAVAALLLLTRPLEAYWLAAPALNRAGRDFGWPDAAAALALGGLSAGLFWTVLCRASRAGRAASLPDAAHPRTASPE